MTPELVIHPRTQEQLRSFTDAPHHALLLAGPDGIGKTTLATHIAQHILGLPPGQLQHYPYFLLAGSDDSGTISIEEVRRIHAFLRLKTTGTAPIRRVVIVQHADGLTTEAQNAFLKLLEEPPADTLIILTAGSKYGLLPTILSRVHVLPVHAPEQTVLQAFFEAAGHHGDTIQRTYFLSGGLPGLMHGLLHGGQDHPLLEQVTVAKELLGKSLFERLALVDALAKQKAGIGPLLDALQRIAGSGIKLASQKQDPKALRQWHSVRKEALLAQEALAKNANSKLLLTKMLLHM